MPKDYRRVFLAVLVVGTASLALSGVTWAESEGRLELNRNSLAVYDRAGESAFVEGGPRLAVRPKSLETRAPQEPTKANDAEEANLPSWPAKWAGESESIDF